MTPLLDAILEKIPAPKIDDERSFKMLVSSFDYDSHLGRIVIGKVKQGKIQKGKKVIISFLVLIRQEVNNIKFAISFK